jgi:exoribonuclease R
MDINKIIYGVLEINNKTAFGEKNEKRFYPNDKTLPTFYVPTKKLFSTINLYCCIKFNKQVGDKYYGLIEKFIGEIGDLNSELDYLKNIGCDQWKGNSKFKLEEYSEDLTPDRVDFTKFKLKAYSIDPPGCVDIDDALSIELISENHCKIFIHIADVSSYIKPESLLDLEIRKRKESIYLNKFQVNMIPDKLSIEKISLKKINRAFTLELTLMKTDKWNIISHSFYKSLIKVINLSYDECQAQLDKNKDLKNLYNIGKDLYENKFGKCEYNSHLMVEIYMIIANVIAGKNIQDHEGAIFRKQDPSLENKFFDNVASYSSFRNDLTHTSLKESLYTHFTSPMRRYIDIIVHRILSNKFCGSNFVINKDESFIDSLNATHKKIKKINRIAELYCNILNKEFKECESYNGTIIGFANNKLIVYIKKMGIINVKLFDKKFSELYECKIDKSCELYDKANNKKTEFNINQEINIIISITKYSPKKINAKLAT